MGRFSLHMDDFNLILCRVKRLNGKIFRESLQNTKNHKSEVKPLKCHLSQFNCQLHVKFVMFTVYSVCLHSVQRLRCLKIMHYSELKAQFSIE